MHDETPPSGDRKSGLRFTSMRRHRRSSGFPYGMIAVVVIVLLGVGLGSWLWLRSTGDDVRPAAPTAAAQEDPARERPDVPPLDLPELGASDDFVRRVVSRLSAHPQLARWLVTDDLVFRFVHSVVALAGASSPREHLGFMEPDGEFRVREAGGRLTIDPSSHRRYDLLTATFASLDTEDAATLYLQLLPLFEEAYAELGIPDRSFDETFEMAVGNILAVRVPGGPVEVAPDEAVYVYRNPALESSTPAAKHLVRMGEENARQVQSKLAELARALDMGVEG